MKIYSLQTTQSLSISPEQAWDFFSKPENLSELTPPDMDFKIISDPEKEMFPGQIITYKIGVLPGIKRTWVTEIKNVEVMKSFIDEQRFGPYKFWYHKHSFEKNGSGIVMKDNIQYAVPFGLIGRVLHKLFIRNKLEKIFKYRFDYLNRKFNEE